MSRYSNFAPRLISLKPEYLNPSDSGAFPLVSTNITDTSYDPNYIVTEIQQQQKDLTDDEILQITRRYSEGASVYELARDFDCHRSTISRHLRLQGITVSNKVIDRPALVERVLQMYADRMHAKQIGTELDISPKSVSKILHDNNVRIRHSTEYHK
ncbi:RNA polymerase sigma factor, sigma-70 family [Slackia heliotrinireducens]|uniref:Transposase IS30-like HTH domain-containing protein n=1 Tax=Slackia heliotrinireducens (strain ATCC 29202 / DSM 20476 / NCTC 11029 / RHS 1) TaxID=471855 RepID=C7N502_SLAHD|nr:helix-turn-helix domain-containing protein [Slackia heliotrinireducens]ACV21987.1 hypothetical protein Shel_09470 [Slackia heliotrinireducens DSM 20476]VEG99876.1 RNA polymerase sigma factor, sigma-70 family [Slackia heliotrinireducens]